MFHDVVLVDYLKNTDKKYLKLTKNTRLEIALSRMNLNKAIKRLVDEGVLEFYRGNNIRIYRIIKQKLE
jgi:hypothetical protein